MNRIKVKLSPWWTGSVKDRFNQQFIGSYFINHDIELVDGDDYDFLVIVGNKKEEEDILVPEDRVLVFTMEPNWSPNACKNAHEYSNRVYIRDKNDHPESESYIETPLYIMYGGNGDMHHEQKWNWSVDALIGSDYQANKLLSTVQRNQECSWIADQDAQNILYTKRCDLVNSLLTSSTDIDIYGQYWEEDGNKIKGVAWNKKVGLLDYKFSIAIENTIEQNYITEKFWDCILTQTVPVYFGCPNIADLIPSNCYISLPEIGNIDECIKTINNNCTDEIYKNMLDEVHNLRYTFFSEPKFNIWHKIQEEIINS
jgi:hypothetical protein